MITQTTDPELISRVINHKDVFPWVSDDKTPKPYDPNMDNGSIFLTDETEKSVIEIDPLNGIMCQVHMAALPELWGNCHHIVIDALIWGFKNTGFMKVLGIIPDCNIFVKKLLVDSGFKKEGMITKAYLKGWKLYDMEIYGITKQAFKRLQEDICHKQQEQQL